MLLLQLGGGSTLRRRRRCRRVVVTVLVGQVTCVGDLGPPRRIQKRSMFETGMGTRADGRLALVFCGNWKASNLGATFHIEGVEKGPVEGEFPALFPKWAALT